MTVTERRTDEQRVGDLVDDLLREHPPPLDQRHRVPRRAVRPGSGLGPLPEGPRRARPVAQAAERSSTSASSPPAAPTRTTATRSATACAARRWWSGGARSRSSATCGRCSPARRSGASSSREPGSGSDFAGLAARGVRDGDEWIVNGQKVWTTLAHVSKWGLLVVRTDAEAVKHAGPDGVRGRHGGARGRGAAAAPDDRRGRVQRGVLHRHPHPRRRDARRPGRRLAGVADDADERAGVDRRRGGPEGRPAPSAAAVNLWKSLPAGTPGRRRPGRADEAVDPQRDRPADQHPGRAEPQGRRARARGLDRQAGLRRGQQGRLRALRRPDGRRRDALRLLRDGPAGDAMGADTLQKAFLRSRANSIEGGTSEVMRNILGERVLGPARRRPGRPGRAAWSEVPRN